MGVRDVPTELNQDSMSNLQSFRNRDPIGTKIQALLTAGTSISVDYKRSILFSGPFSQVISIIVAFEAENIRDWYSLWTRKAIPTISTKPLSCLPYTFHERFNLFYSQLPWLPPYLKVLIQLIWFYHPRDGAGDI